MSVGLRRGGGLFRTRFALVAESTVAQANALVVFALTGVAAAAAAVMAGELLRG